MFQIIKEFLNLVVLFTTGFFNIPYVRINAPIVETSVGTIIGTTKMAQGIPVYQFLSIPYAKPPTGERRFKKPEPKEAWSKPLLATAQPPACIQYTQNPFPWYDNDTIRNEDCLYLNIWIPSNAGPGNKKAVLFWIFGGGFFVGSIRQEVYNGDTISALGDVVVVTVNYRVGSFGFLYSGSDDAPGNVGVWDMLAGLQWVHDHIESFGGDASRITVAGESSGSISAGLFAVSPLTTGLYARLIMQSGSPAYILADDNAQSSVLSQKIAEIVGCANSTLTLERDPVTVVDCLRNVDALNLIKAEASLFPHASSSFVPRYGDAILPTNPRQAVITKNFRNSDVLIGNNKDEGSFVVTTTNPRIYGFFGDKNPQINKSTGEDMLRTYFANFTNTEAVVQYYLPQSLQEDNYDVVRRQVYTALGDFTFLCPTVFFAEKFAEKSNKVFFYLWLHRPSNTPWARWMGTAHFSEVAFLFGQPVKHPNLYVRGEDQLSMDFIYKWTNFVKHGNPMKQWPLYSKENPELLYIDSGPERYGTGPHRENCNFFRPYFGF